MIEINEQIKNQALIIKQEQQQISWYKFSLSQILLFYQPIKSLINYNTCNNHQELMSCSKINYQILTPLQKTRFSAFSDELEVIQILLIQNFRKNPNLIKAICQTQRAQLLYYIIIVQLCVLSKLGISYLLSLTIQQVSQYLQSEDNEKGQKFMDMILFCTILSAMLILSSFLEQHYFQNIYQFSMRLRMMIVGLIYSHISNTSFTRMRDVSKGQLFNIITMDVSDIDLTWLLALSGSIIISIVGTFQLYNLFGVSAFIGLIMLFFINYLQRSILDYQAKFKKSKNLIQDKRTKLTGEVLQNLRTLKMYAVEHIYRNQIVRLRSSQDNFTLKILRLDSFSQLLAGNIAILISLLIMIIFHVNVFNAQITPEIIFGSLWVLCLIKVWCLTYFYRGRKFWLNVKILNQRLSQVLLDTMDVEIRQVKDGFSNINKGVYKIAEEETEYDILYQQQQQQQIQDQGIGIVFENYNASWQKADFDLEWYNLEGINLRINQVQMGNENDIGIIGQLIIILGRVGSGKSTLISAILDEIPYYNGIKQIKGTVAYVEQNPFIFSGTIQQNILFGLEYDEVKYMKSIKMSCLQEDLIQRSDQSQVGDRGVKLSGGQRARLSLARAIYSDSDIYLLDDVLSAVDAKVGAKIFDQCIMELRNQGKLIIMVSHNLNYAQISDRVIVVKNKKIVNDAIGYDSIQNLLKKDSLVNNINHNPNKNNIETDEQAKIFNESENEITYSEISTDLYKKYINEIGGYKILIYIIIAYLSDSFVNLMINKTLANWSQSQDNNQYIRIIIILLVLYIITTLVKLNLLFGYTLSAIGNMHRKLITSVTRATIQVIDQYGIGQLLARFTSDLNNIESLVMLDQHWAIEGCTDNVFVIIFVCTQNVLTITAAMVFLILMFQIKKRFTNAMKYAIKCDDISRGQLLNYIEESIEGAILIRTYRQNQYFQNNLQSLCYQNLQSYFQFLRLNATLSFIFEMSLNILIIFTLYCIVLFNVGRKSNVDININNNNNNDASNVGFSLIMLLNLGYMFSLNLRGQIYLDIDMQNVQRIQNTLIIPRESHIEYDQDYQIINRWPQKGSIQFQNVSMTYDKKMLGINSKNYAVKNISFTIEGGESLGIVGRTGAGKSSIINCLFRLVDLDSGSIFIDDLDIDSMGLHTLRQNILVIPQNTPLLSLSVRNNIDPHDRYTDDRIWDCIRELNLEAKINKLPHGLQTIISQDMFSEGEKQLFCMISILLHDKPKILIFDEATSNLDQQTDELIQKIIKNRFHQITKIIIAHRLQTVIGCDNIMVMNYGEIIEYEKPYNLIINPQNSNGLKSMIDALEDDQKQVLMEQFSKYKL